MSLSLTVPEILELPTDGRARQTDRRILRFHKESQFFRSLIKVAIVLDYDRKFIYGHNDRECYKTIEKTLKYGAHTVLKAFIFLKHKYENGSIFAKKNAELEENERRDNDKERERVGEWLKVKLRV